MRELRSVLGKSVHVDIANEAADRIEQQAAEIARLQDALRDATYAKTWGDAQAIIDAARKEAP